MSNFTLAAAMTLDNRRFLGGMRQSRSATGAAVGGLRSLIAPLATLTAGYLSLRGAVGLANQSLTQAAGAERTRATFEILLGSAKEAKDLFNDLTQFSDVTPFEPGPVQQAAKALLAAKFEARDLRGLLTDAGDLASVMDKDIGEVANAFARLNSGDFGESFERLRDFGITRPDLEGQGLKFDKGGSYQGSVEQAMTAVRNIIQTRFGGTMERISQTNVGLMSTLTGAWKEVQRVFGEPINNELKPVLKDAIEWMKGMKEEAAEWGKTVADGVKLIYEALKQDRGMDLLKAGLELAAANFGNLLINGMTRAAEAMGAALAAIIDSTVLPGLGAGMNSVGLSFAASIASALEEFVPDAYKASVRAATGVGISKVVNDDFKNRGFIQRGSNLKRQLTPEGFEAAKRQGIDVEGLDPTQALIKFQREEIRRQTDSAMSGPSSSEQITKSAEREAAKASELLGEGVPKALKLFMNSLESASQESQNKDLFGAGVAKANFDRMKADISPVGGIMDFLSGNLADFRQKVFGDPLGPENKPTTNPLTETAQSVRTITADRLQRIGGFVGGMSPERRSADRTAKATEESAKRLKAIESKLQPTGGLTPAAWA